MSHVQGIQEIGICFSNRECIHTPGISTSSQRSALQCGRHRRIAANAEQAADLFYAFKDTEEGRKEKDVVQGQIDDAKWLDEFRGICDSGRQNQYFAGAEQEVEKN